MKLKSLFISLALFFSLSLILQAEVQVRSEFSPSVISEGQRCTYNLILEGDGGSPEGVLPRITGLDIDTNASTSKNYSIINGKTSHIVTYSFRVTPKHKGSFTYPSWEIKIGNKTYQVPEATLRVTEADQKFKEAIFTTLDLPQTLYVGQSYATHFELWVRNDVKLRDLASPLKSGEGWAQSEINNELASQTQRNYKGARYQVISWPLSVTPIKSTAEAIQYEVEVAVELPQAQSSQSNRRRYHNSFFDSFFDDPFSNRGQIQQMRVSSPAQNLEIRELPQENKPVDFSGAIGHFDIELKRSVDDLQVGDPLTLTLSVKGEGNFERISAPDIQLDEHWKAYPPKVELISDDPLQLKGEKKFEYILIPLDESPRQIPLPRFSYFDPKTQDYESPESPPLAIQIEAAKFEKQTFKIANFGQTAQALNSEKEQKEEIKIPSDYLPINLLPGKSHSQIRPLILRPIYLYAQGIPFLALLGLIFWKRRTDKLTHDQDYVHKLKAGKRVRQYLKEAQKEKNALRPSEFYNAACLSLQALVVEKASIRMEPESITLVEINKILQGKSASEELKKDIAHFFNTRDAIQFADKSPDNTELKTDWKSLQSLIKKLSQTLA